MIMALFLFRRGSTYLLEMSSRLRSMSGSICSSTQKGFLVEDRESTHLDSVTNQANAPKNYVNLLSPLAGDDKTHLDGCGVELVDDDAWQVSLGVAHAWQGLDAGTQRNSLAGVAINDDDDDDNGSSVVEGDPDFDEIDNMRIQGNLFYKIDRGSKEFEEYSYDFHRKKSSKKKEGNKERESKKESTKNKDDCKESKKKENPSHETVIGITKGYSINPLFHELDSSCVGEKNKRTPTFNQLTAPYHFPFCLDIFISKASVRACIIHRVTSKVVAVAHSISKDMKFDLASTRNAAACTAVGGILAQRALADDIHDVIYTPRKGDKIEGKLQIVLQSIIDNGVNVTVKLKQRKTKKTSHLTMA